MEIIKHELNIKDKPIKIYPLADLHIGDRHVDYKKIASTINEIIADPCAYWIGDGDFMNTAIVGSKSDIYTEEISPMEQLGRCIDLFTPIKDKCLALLPGNHEERISRNTGIDIVRFLARELEIEDRYSDTSALIFVKFGENIAHKRSQKLTYTLYVNHGNGGGKRVGGKLNNLEDLSKIVGDADLYICGHTHLPAAFRKQVITCNRSNGTTTYRDQLFVNTCSMLDWSGSYGDRKGYQPASKELPIITLDPHKVKATVTI